MLVFNDTHLMDDASLDLIGQLAADAPSRPWLVVVSRRPDSPSPLRTDGAFERMLLEPLGADAVGEMIAGSDVDLSPHRVQWLVERAAGNPLFVKELLATGVADGGGAALPRSVEAAIAARIDALSPAERRTLRCAAVLGVVVERPLLEQVLGEESLELGTLEEFLEESADGIHWRFSHQLVRDVAYEGLPYRRRSELHARTAAALVQRDTGELAEILSVHCCEGQWFGQGWRYSLIAAERARERYAIGDAAIALRRALAAAAQLPELDPLEVARVRELLADALYELGEFTGAERELRRALRSPGLGPRSCAQLHLKIAKLREVAGQHRAALTWLSRGEESLRGLMDREARALTAQLITRRARIRQSRGHYHGALRDAEQVISLAPSVGAMRTLAEALELADRASRALAISDDATRTERALAIYTEMGDLAGEARVRNTLGILAYYRGEWPVAVEHYTAAADAYARAGRWWGAGLGRANVAEVRIDQGHLVEAGRLLDEAASAWRGAWAPPDFAFAQSLRGKLAARSGRFEEAVTVLSQAQEIYRQAGETDEQLGVEAMIAESRLLAGEYSWALESSETLLARVGGREGGGALTPALQRVRGMALVATGSVDEGLAALRVSLKTARESRLPHEVAFTLRALLPLESDPALGSEYRALASSLGLDERPRSA